MNAGQDETVSRLEILAGNELGDFGRFANRPYGKNVPNDDFETASDARPTEEGIASSFHSAR
jgi:hypothetical protein